MRNTRRPSSLTHARRAFGGAAVLLLLTIGAAPSAHAQTRDTTTKSGVRPPRDTTGAAAAAPVRDTTANAPPVKKDTAAVAPKVVTPQLDFSGVMFGNYQYRSDSAASAPLGGKHPNKFEIERVYLTFRMPVGEHASIRATSDIFQNTANGFYNGWTVRLKYAYLQYDFLRDIGGMKGFNALGRIGVLHTVLIDHVEGFWPRYLSQTAVERNGFFSSSDLGVATSISLPHKFGEVYGTVTNGPGYTSAETDRFKDVAARVSLTPFGTQTGILKGVTVSPWAYKGYTGSKFQNGGTGQRAPITDGLKRDRWGVFAGIKDRRFTAGGDYARRIEGVEAGSNTSDSPRTLTENTGELVDAFVVARPLEWINSANRSSVGFVARWDQFKPNRDAVSTAGATPANRLAILGLFWEPTARTSLALDYQSLAPRSGSTTPAAKTLFAHWQASF